MTVQPRLGSVCPSRLFRRAEFHHLKIQVEVEQKNVAKRAPARSRASRARDRAPLVTRRLLGQAKMATQMDTMTKVCGQRREECKKTSKAISLDGTLSRIPNSAEAVRRRAWRKPRRGRRPWMAWSRSRRYPTTCQIILTQISS